ncbi:hypothetical protein WN944_006359 [Citrus x changshan-huyou]|uniref:Uncharacterized protein n=1 Tax=Citrus x changshan-huyou TaxID=2935761 RepID=A0AAP0MJ18_9ROSI
MLLLASYERTDENTEYEVLLYLQVDFILPLVQCPNYKDGLRVIFHIAVEHRFFKLRKGVGLNIVKVMVASLGLLASYERLKLKKGASLNIVKAMASILGLLASYKRIDEDIEAEKTNHDVPMPYFGIGLE